MEEASGHVRAELSVCLRRGTPQMGVYALGVEFLRREPCPAARIMR